MAPKAQTVVAITGSQDLLRRRALRTTILTQEKGGWRIDQVDGSNTNALRNATSVGGGFFDSNRVLVIVANPEKANLDVLEQHLTEGDPECVLLLDYPKDPKETSKFGKFLAKLGKSHRHYPAPAKTWQAEELAVKFCVEEAQRLGKTLGLDHASIIVDRAGSDLGVLSFEILKMSMLAEAEGTTVLTAQIIGGGLAPLIGVSLNPLTDALAAKNKVKLCKILARIKKTTKGDPTIQVCRWLGKSALDWLMAIDLRDKGVSAEEAAEQLSLNVYFYKNQILPKVRTWTLFEATQLVKALADSERAVLNGHINPWVCMTARLLRVCDGTRTDNSPLVVALPYREAPPVPMAAPVAQAIPVTETTLLDSLESMTAKEEVRPRKPSPVRVEDFKFDPTDTFLSATSDPRQFLAPQFPIPFLVPPDVWQQCCDFKDQVLEKRRSTYEGRGDGGNVSPRDLVGGKAAEVILAQLLQHLGFPKLDPCFSVQSNPTWAPDLQYSKISEFPDVHVKASGMPDFTGGTFQFLKGTDEVFLPSKGTKTELREYYATHMDTSGVSWEYHPGTSVLGELVALLKYTQIPSLIQDYNPRKPPLVIFYALFPFHYLFDHPLMQPRLDRNPTKLAFYYETLLYFLGRSTQVYIPGRGLVTVK
jgi:DNA polymerase III delta subunit